ncbi:MAG: hypothetical protein E7664_03315 [Ruminococcaceae bacterium]|nr:hypothetical protein [Oscillospiraceae bacterium]
MKHRILLTILSLSLPLFVCCRQTAAVADTEPLEAVERSCVLSPTEDAGKEYVDSILFFGESTTAHMVSRGVLSGGAETKQVLRTPSGTVNLGMDTPRVRVIQPYTGELVSLYDAVRAIKPRYLLLTFGLNGAVQNAAAGEERYAYVYTSLIQNMKEASPNTVILLQSCPPVAISMDMSHYSVSAAELNERLRTINTWIERISQSTGTSFLNSAEVLTDENGYLYEDYQNGDGYHLSVRGYEVMLRYIRTHAHPLQEAHG